MSQPQCGLGYIIEILEFRVSNFCKFFEKTDRLLNSAVWLILLATSGRFSDKLCKIYRFNQNSFYFLFPVTDMI